MFNSAFNSKQEFYLLKILEHTFLLGDLFLLYCIFFYFVVGYLLFTTECTFKLKH